MLKIFNKTVRIAKNKSKSKYKLRAECSHDVVQFIESQHSKLSSFELTRVEGLPDVDFEFETNLGIDEIISALKNIDNSHVMYQTVMPLADYTGKRNYDIE